MMVCASLWRGEIVLRHASEPLAALIARVANSHGVNVSDLFGKSRVAEIARARQELMWELHRKRGWSLPKIGRYLNRDHTTILYGVRQHDKLAEMQDVK